MAKTLEIYPVGHPILRQQAQRLEDTVNPDFQALIQQLIDTVIATQGVGIAAPQVGQSQRVFIVASHPNPRYPHAPLMPPTPMLNPRILSHSTEQVKDWEGCLSVPGLRGLVPRYQTIEVEYTDSTRQLQQRQLTDFVARIFQHELDHLNGKLFLDRIESPQDLVVSR
jgi:peptide deformylase